jgi:hypothetical protein
MGLIWGDTFQTIERCNELKCSSFISKIKINPLVDSFFCIGHPVETGPNVYPTLFTSYLMEFLNTTLIKKQD